MNKNTKNINDFLGEGSSAFAAFAICTVQDLFDKARATIYKALPGVTLNTPFFELFESNSHWGQWFQEKRTIRLNIRLFRDFDESAIRFVLYHEIAHMIVHEIFNMADDVRSHGEAFKKACVILGIDDARCHSDEYLARLNQETATTDLIRKIRALIAKGQSEGVSQAESESFLRKAQELCDKNKIDSKVLRNNESAKFVARPVGPYSGRYPTYMNPIYNILVDYYNVKGIKSYVRCESEYRPKGIKKYSNQVLFIFGRREDVEIAEYVVEQLLSQAEFIFKNYVKNEKQDGEKINKRNFFYGLFSRFRDILDSQRDKLSVENPEYYALISADDPLLDEMFKKAYSNQHKTYSQYRVRSGFYAGTGQAGKLSVRNGLNPKATALIA